MKPLTNFSLKNNNSLKVNSIAKYYFDIHSIEQLIEIIGADLFKENHFCILGNGTNVLFASEFYDGVILKNSIERYIKVEIKNDNLVITADSGFDFEQVINEYLCFQKFTNYTAFGLENLALIPGNVGGAIVSNIGAYGVEQSDYFVECSAVNLFTGEQRIFTKVECCFGYRSSIFKSSVNHINPYFITEAKYSIPLNSSPILTNKELKSRIMQLNELTTPRLVYNAIYEIRSEKLPSLEKFPNAGSFFKNPKITQEQLNSILAIEPRVAYFIDEVIKVSAASLIEHSGLKGKREGGVGVSGQHALVLVNYGGATGEEILSFSEMVVSEVKMKFGIVLEREVVVI